jgi:hypothetical protein
MLVPLHTMAVRFFIDGSRVGRLWQMPHWRREYCAELVTAVKSNELQERQPETFQIDDLRVHRWGTSAAFDAVKKFDLALIESSY